MPSSPAHLEAWHPLPQWFRTTAALRDAAVLLETAKFDADNYRSHLFVDPICTLTAWNPNEVATVFAEADMHLRRGCYVAGFVSYECGEVLHGIAPRQQQRSQNIPLMRMGVFRCPVTFDHRTGSITGKEPAVPAPLSCEPAQSAVVHQANLQITAAEYEYQVGRIQDYLAAGHSYQVNFTDKVAGTFTGTPLNLYEQVLTQQPVPFAAFVNAGDKQMLSFSPELFYCVNDRRIRVRPMKGTWPRGRNATEDEVAAHDLRKDEKNRAEHITIVDLLRNDLGRVCELGSVKVDALMRVERYRTLHQMTSDISGTLQSRLTPSEVFRALFPSGSITGAPKCRTMQIIQETERVARGVYTGSIGYFGPHGEACFSVAIRTLLVQNNTFVLGVGGGITVDSTPACEYEECKLKASFLASQPEFYLFETMRAANRAILRLDAHLARMRASALYFDYRFDEPGIRHDLTTSLSHLDHAAARVKLLLERDGRWRIETSPLDELPWSGRVLLWPEPVSSSDFFLQHKTSHRDLYRRALLEAQQQGYDEVLFRNEAGFVTEGAISNLFVTTGGTTITPNTRDGLLPGIERAHILRSCPSVHVGPILLQDLRAADAVWLTNALRGSRPISVVEDSQGRVLWRQRLEAVCDSITVHRTYYVPVADVP